MAPKKKRKKTIKKKKMKSYTLDRDDNRQDNANAYAPVIASLPQEEWVTLDMKLLDWDYMDFQTTVNINTNIYTIHKLIQSKHGRVKDVKLYKDAIVKEENELLCGHDDDNGMNNTGWSGSKTLKEWGVEGGVIKEDAPVLSICYDFKPLNANHDPILLSWMG